MMKINFGGCKWRPTGQVEVENMFYLVLAVSGALFLTELVVIFKNQENSQRSLESRAFFIKWMVSKQPAYEHWKSPPGLSQGGLHSPNMCWPVSCGPLLAISLIHRPTWAWGHLSLQPVVQVIESVQRPRASDSIRELGKTIDVS